jgi:hypothetical protein
MKPRTGNEAVVAGPKAGETLLRSKAMEGRGEKRCVGKWVQVGKGGCETGKRRSFSHFETALTRLFPHKSTQVVDFPRMYEVRVFRGWGKKEPLRHEGTEAYETWNQGGDGGEKLCKKIRIVWLPKPATRWAPQWSCSLARNVVAKSPRKFGLFHESSRSYAKVRTDQGRGYAMLRIVTGKSNFLRESQFKRATKNL